MTDKDFIALARQAGWEAVSPVIVAKLIAYGRIIEQEILQGRSPTDSGNSNQSEK